MKSRTKQQICRICNDRVATRTCGICGGGNCEDHRKSCFACEDCFHDNSKCCDTIIQETTPVFSELDHLRNSMEHIRTILKYAKPNSIKEYKKTFKSILILSENYKDPKL